MSSFNPYSAMELGLNAQQPRQHAAHRAQRQRLQQQQTAQTQPAPTAELSENKHWVRLTVDLPGVLPKDLDVAIQHGVLTISGARKTMSVDNTVCLKKQKICRRYAIDTDIVDVSKVSANLSLGVLSVRAPKRAREDSMRVNVTENAEFGGHQAEDSNDHIPLTEGLLPTVPPFISSETSGATTTKNVSLTTQTELEPLGVPAIDESADAAPAAHVKADEVTTVSDSSEDSSKSNV
jgi:HSP20 family protein